MFVESLQILQQLREKNDKVESTIDSTLRIGLVDRSVTRTKN